MEFLEYRGGVCRKISLGDAGESRKLSDTLVPCPADFNISNLPFTQIKNKEIVIDAVRKLASLEEAKKAEERCWRDAELKETDFEDLPNAPLSISQKAESKAYRTSLRNWPDWVGFPDCEKRPIR